MKKILVVCTGGLGTSLILKLEIKKFFLDHSIAVSVEQSDATAAGFFSADVIIGAKQIIDTFQRRPSITYIPLTLIADRKHIREQLSNNPLIQEWMNES